MSKQYRAERWVQELHGYNLVISNAIVNSARRASRSASLFRTAARFFVLALGFALPAYATDWSAPEQELARKIAAVTGSGAVSLSFENRSSLGERDAEIIQNGLRSTLTAMGMRLGQNDAAAITVRISLSENPASFVWVAQIQKAGGEVAVAMATFPRAQNLNVVREAVPLSLRKIPLWSQTEPILDLAVLEENAGAMRIAVLSPKKVSLYRMRAGNSQLEAEAEITHSRAWPRDLRGRIVPAKDHIVDVYLPGVMCRSSTAAPFTLNCLDGDVSWPLITGTNGSSLSGNETWMVSSIAVQAFFDSSRNFFTSIETIPGGAVKAVPQFYSAALFPRDRNLLWLFAGVDGEIHVFDGTADRAVKLNWGSDLTSVRTSCGAGWQALVTSPVQEEADSVRAYEIPDRDPVAVSAAIDFSGPVSALWTEAKGDTAIAIAKNSETGNYEAFRLAVACGQ